MKKQFLLTALLLWACTFLAAQTSDYKVVFDITSQDTTNHKVVMRQAAGIVKANPNAQVEVVIYSNALPLVVKDKSVVAQSLQELLKNDRAKVKVCAITMERNNVSRSDLVPGVQVVPDGIYEIITRQRQGWGYIKVGN